EETTLTEHVLSNILSNAIKFSHHNSRIKISVTDQDENLEIKIRDYGVGIGKDLLKKRFLQSTEGTEGETGSGFGMMIMSYFLHQFGGRYEMHSEGLGQGTTVTLKLKKSNAFI